VGMFVRHNVRLYFFNFVHLPSAMEDNNTDPVIIWWWLRPVETA
jgi:hypothetical protein